MKCHATITKEGVLAHMREHKKRWRNRTLADSLAIDPAEMRGLLDSLVASGEVRVSVERERWYYLAEQSAKFMKSTSAVVTPPPYVNIWTKPLRYNLHAHADLAMAARSA